MAALANGSILVLVSVFVFYEAAQRFQSPPEVKTPLMLIIAGIGLVANLIGVALLERGSHGSLDVRGAFWHVLGDTISSVGVIIAGTRMTITGWTVADPIAAIVIGVIILWGAVRLVRDSVDDPNGEIPKTISVEKVVEDIRQVPGIQEIHDIHVWTITSEIVALSAHLMIRTRWSA